MNEVTTVCKTLVYKRYALPQKCENEIAAIEALAQIIPNNVPVIINKNFNLCILEYIDGLSGIDIKNITNLNELIAELIFKISNSYNLVENKDIKPWKDSVQNLTNDFEKYKPLLNQQIDKNLTAKLLKNLKLIAEIKIEPDKLTLVHRDLHLGNIILNENGCVFLDFEHVMEAPLEMEFQNSLFWNDEMSLNVNEIKKLLIKAGLNYSNKLEEMLLNYYAADQLVLALEENNKEKLQKIAEIYSRIII